MGWDFYFLQYFQELCEGTFPAPEGLTHTAADADGRAEELQRQIAALGIPEFVRLCAAARGDEIDPATFENYDPATLGALGGALAQGAPERGKSGAAGGARGCAENE